VIGTCHQRSLEHLGAYLDELEHRSHNRGNQFLFRDTLLNEVWGVDYYGTTRTLDQLIVKLRQKIEDVPGEPRHLLTVHTLGYRLEV
jgi:DNA-binding response OmpR family regulator